jgi:hypothetical protein
MKSTPLAVLFILFFVCVGGTVGAHAQACTLGGGSTPWTNLLCPSRAIDWKNAGLPASLPDGETTPNPWTPPTRVACTTAQAGITVPVASGTSFSSIVTAMNNCSSANTTGSYLLLAPGSFTLSAYAYLNSAPYVTLRGSGAQSTTLTLSGTMALQMGSSGSYGGGTVSSSPAAGTASVTVTSVSGVTPVAGNMAWFNQCDTGWSGSTSPTNGYNTCGTGSYSDNGAVFVCGGTTTCNSNGSGSGGGGQSSQFQYVLMTNVVNNGGGSYTITFSPGLYLPNWSTSNTVSMYWQTKSNVGYGVGIEDMTVVFANGANEQVQLGSAYASWVKGVRFIGAAANRELLISTCKNCLVFNNYFFGMNPSVPSGNSTTISMVNTSDTLLLNNASDQALFLEGAGSHEGNVIAYTYAHNVTNSYVQTANYQHDNDASGVALLLNEGNETNEIDDDDTWGTGDLNTAFRNQTSCTDQPYIYSSVTGNAISVDSFHRFDNVIGNVLGGSSQCTAYKGSSNGSEIRIDSQGKDLLTTSSAMLWGNYDSVGATNQFNSSEVPTSLSGNAAPFENPAPSSHSLPASFFMDSMGFYPSGGTGLSWWKVCTSWTTFPTSCAGTKTQPFPTAGPDVTDGNNMDGFAYDNPAALAWKTLPTDATQQNSYTVTASSWSGGTETLTVSDLPSGTHVMGGFQLSGASGSCVPSTGVSSTAAYRTDNEILLTGASSTQISYALASNPGSNACTGTMRWPDVRQFDERVYESDPSGGTGPNPPSGLAASVE